ncbi:MAG: DNA mismatch repair protein MutS [Chitinophagaceae bacterium]
MKLYPESAETQLEFDKVKTLLVNYCKSEYAKEKAAKLRIHTRKDYVELELGQTNEFKNILQQQQYFPNDFTPTIAKELKLLGIPGSLLTEEQFMLVKRLAESLEKIFHWFDNERRERFPGLAFVIQDSYYEKNINLLIDDIIDEFGHVRDNATPELEKIRTNLSKKRNELRRLFARAVARLQKAGYTADIDESFSNGRRVVAVFSEHKRQVKGILHGESDSRRTAFIEPEETIEINNEVFDLEMEERKEISRILRELTARLSVYAPLLKSYHNFLGLYDFIEAKAKLALEMGGALPVIMDKPILELINAYHPLLYLYNKKNGKATVPLNLTLDADNRILIISGPNAGGKTVTMKTIGLNQLMLQSGLLVAMSPDSHIGIFKQLFIQIGDTQSLEFELSTYSSHLTNMKYFIENANGKTLFFIDELGSGSDPNLGGAFAEVILEELAKKHSIGLVTTHYLNLKVMANHTKGILNGAMAFDEVHLQPLYKLIVGKPGSSYTFSIAERIGLPQNLINRARRLVEEDHFRLDKLLNSTEQGLQQLDKEKKELHKLIRENEHLKKEMAQVLNKERHQQKIELLQQQNQITEERITYLRDTERKLKQLVVDWRKTDDKEEVINGIYQLLFPQKDKLLSNKLSKKIREQYDEISGEVEVGSKVILRKSHQVGEVQEIRGKRAIVKIGLLPMNVDIADLRIVKEKEDSTI